MVTVIKGLIFKRGIHIDSYVFSKPEEQLRWFTRLAAVISEINQPLNRVISVQMEASRFIEHHCIVACCESELSIRRKHFCCEKIHLDMGLLLQTHSIRHTVLQHTPQRLGDFYQHFNIIPNLPIICIYLSNNCIFNFYLILKCFVLLDWQSQTEIPSV